MQESLDQASPPLVDADHKMRKRQLITVVLILCTNCIPMASDLSRSCRPARIERDLEIDSLGRTELILRIERAFHVRLPAQMIGESESVQGFDSGA